MSVARHLNETSTGNSREAGLAPPPRAHEVDVASVAYPQCVVGAYSPKLRSSQSVRGVLVASKLRSPVASQSCVPASSVLRRACSVASRGVASPKFVVSPVLHSIRLAARARKVSRLARRLDGIADGHKRQQL